MLLQLGTRFLAGALMAGLPAPAVKFEANKAPASVLWLDSLDLSGIEQGWGEAHGGRTVDNHPLTLGGQVYQHGIGTHSPGEWVLDLQGSALSFHALGGLDDEAKDRGSVSFQAWVDGVLRAETSVIRHGDPPQPLSVDLRGARKLVLIVTDGGDGFDWDHADWAGAHIVLDPKSGKKPRPDPIPDDPPPDIIRPTAPEPAIHGPRVFGASPGKPFLFLIPATGEGPMTFSARGLPRGLSLDAKTGIITGVIKAPGKNRVELTVKGPRGSARRSLRILAGPGKLALTPPLGWNSWNVWACAVDQAKVKAAADAFIRTGLAAHGFTYVNIDDCWEAGRSPDGEILGNSKFPDMKALADYVHSKGLKIGLYSSPGPKTCAGFEASFNHEEQDARSYAAWGFDYLKYDWCSSQSKDLKEPYRIMRRALDASGRDIVFSLCQYGMGNVWEWGTEVGGNCWRTTGDITDTWASMSRIGFAQDGHEKFASPGHWNDPDMLVVGSLGWGPSLHKTRLTPWEQLTHISLWSLLSSPLLIGCDLEQLDPYTLALLTNDEVLDLNQDPLAKPARRISKNGDAEVWARPLEDGTLAAGLFNRGRQAAEVEARWEDLGLKGPRAVRDLWLRKDLGAFKESFKTQVPRHGVCLIKIGTPAS